MSRKVILLLLLCPILCFGCSWNIYELEMKPMGTSFERKLTCSKGSATSGSEEGISNSRPSQETLDHLTLVYGEEPSFSGSRKASFKGVFKDTTPQDIGGAGYFTCLETPMGTATGYVERFLGNDDIAGRLEKTFQALDRLMDLVVGFIESELENVPDWNHLQVFMNQQLRSDLKNLAVYFFLSDPSNLELEPKERERQMMERFVSRILLYLAEREYFVPKNLPELVRNLTPELSESDPEPWLTFSRKLLSKKLKVPEESEIIGAVISLLTAKDLEDNMLDYMRTTPEWKRRLAQWNAEKKVNPEAEEPDPKDITGDILKPLQMEGLLQPRECEVKIRLSCAMKPMHTNGIWDEEKKQVCWNGDVISYQILPALASALWITPEEAYQESHFGRVILMDEALLKYVFWYKGLEPNEAGEWDTFLDKLNPNDDLETAIRSFEFSGDQDKDLAAQAKALITLALKE